MYILDRFEGGLALFISENDDVKSLPREDFSDFREGDAFVLSEDGSLVFDEEATKARRSDIKSRFSRLVRRK